MTGLLLGSGNPLDHVVQHTWKTIETPIGNLTILSNHIVMQIIAALVLLILIPRALKYRHNPGHAEGLVPRGFGNAIEATCEFLRKNVAQPALGHHTDTFMPYIWTVFFFILTCNLLGLIPLADWTKPLMSDHGLTHGHGIGGTATGNIWVTSTLAVMTLLMVVGNGLRTNGVAYLKHFFIGPFPISILIAFLEIIGLAAKTFALAMRLFANMIAGHILLAVLLSFIGMAAAGMGSFGAAVISVPIVLGSVAINMLELFVAFLQAFIFTFLTCMFLGQAVNIHHEYEHEDVHESVPVHAHDPGYARHTEPMHAAPAVAGE